MDEKWICEQIAKRINKALTYGKVTVTDTKGIDPRYCADWSITLDDDAYDMLYTMHDKETADVFYGDTFFVGGVEFYLEPYNGTFINVARI